ncbi:MAG: M48 family metallopeptidase [Chitinophagales bacterium]|nr:M48 family metallopeptidase [Chitinophagales bacterium]
MKDFIQLGNIAIEVTRKAVKNIHLSVHPPDGRVSLVAPTHVRLEVARAYAISKLSWIQQQQEKLINQERETPREYVTRESHYLWGRRYLLNVINSNEAAHIELGHQDINLYIKANSTKEKKAAVLYEWQKNLLRAFIKKIVAKWEPILGVKINAFFVQKMKTRWGSCNYQAKNIRLNTELVKKPKDLVEYVIVHELLHLIEPTHNDRFVALMSKFYPTWREARAELNELPLGYVEWS